MQTPRSHQHQPRRHGQARQHSCLNWFV